MFAQVKIQAIAVAAAIAFAIGGLIGAGITGAIYVARVEAAVKAGEAEAERLKREHLEAVAEAATAHGRAVEAMRVEESKLRGDLDRVQAQSEEKDRAKAAADRTIADLRSGARSLRLRATSCYPAGSSEGARSATASTGGGQEARAELAPEAAAALVSIAGDGDDAIRSLNACIDAYEAVRLRINGGASEAPAR